MTGTQQARYDIQDQPLDAPRSTLDAPDAAAPVRPVPRPRPGYDELTLYSPNVDACAIDLSDNTNLWGAPPAAARAVRDGAAGDGPGALTRYPVLYANALKPHLAAYAGVAPDEVTTGCGSDDVLDAAMRAFAVPGELVAHPVPSFSMIPVFARMNGLASVGVPLTGDWDVDADALLATGARIIYVCSPNNPTGTAASRRAIARIVADAPGLVIVDEAYAEFTDDADWAARAPALGNVLATRTLSKAFGLAGLRVGYGTGHAELVAQVERARGPYKVSSAAERAVAAALTDDLPWVRARAAEAVANRARLTAELRARDLAPLPSAANFVLVPTPRAMALGDALAARGVAVRVFPHLAGVGAALRIGVGPWGMMETLLKAIDDVGRGGGE